MVGWVVGPAASVPPRWPAWFRGEGWRWGLDVEETDDKVVVRAEAPGFEPGDFDLGVEDGMLTLRAARKAETKDEKGEMRTTRECYEAVALPAGIDKEKIEDVARHGLERRLAIFRDNHTPPACAQSPGNRARRVSLILDQKRSRRSLGHSPSAI